MSAFFQPSGTLPPDEPENMKSAWGQVEVVSQRRYDLIPNFVNTVKSYVKHEKETLEEVTKYRSQ